MLLFPTLRYSGLGIRWRCEGYCRLLFVSSGLMSPPPFFLKLQELNRNSSTSSSMVSRRENCFLLTFLCFFAPTLEIPPNSMLRTNAAENISWQISSKSALFPQVARAELQLINIIIHGLNKKKLFSLNFFMFFCSYSWNTTAQHAVDKCS